METHSIRRLKWMLCGAQPSTYRDWRVHKTRNWCQTCIQRRHNCLTRDIMTSQHIHHGLPVAREALSDRAVGNAARWECVSEWVSDYNNYYSQQNIQSKYLRCTGCWTTDSSSFVCIAKQRCTLTCGMNVLAEYTLTRRNIDTHTFPLSYKERSFVLVGDCTRANCQFISSVGSTAHYY